MAKGKDKKKKTFQDRTGIRFADLIMPMVLGGIGSYSNAAGRGVGLGLQAFRTFQSGREYNDERRLGKDMSEYFGGTVEDLEEKIQALKDENSGIIKTSSNPYFDTANLPDPKRPVGEGEIEDTYSSENTGSMFDGMSMFGGAPEDASILGIANNAQPIELGNPEALLEAKRRQEEIARDIEIAEGRKRFYDIAQLTAKTNPGTAGYMTMQEQGQRLAEQKATEAMLTNAQLLSEGKKESYYYDIAKETHKQIGKKELEILKSRLRADFSPIVTKDENGNDVTWSVNKRTGEWAKTSEVDSRKISLQDLPGLPLETRMELFDRASKSYNTLLNTDAETNSVDKDLLANYKFMLGSLWASMKNPTDMTGLVTMLNQFNQDRAQRGLEPLTMEEWLKQSGITVGLDGKPLAPGTGGSGNGGGGGYSNAIDLN